MHPKTINLALLYYADKKNTHTKTDTSKLIIPEYRGSTSNKGAKRRRDQEKSGEASVP